MQTGVYFDVKKVFVWFVLGRRFITRDVWDQSRSQSRPPGPGPKKLYFTGTGTRTGTVAK